MSLLWHAERLLRGPRESPPRAAYPGGVVLASFPKSGSTWLRFMYANLMRARVGGPEVDFHTLGAYLPDLRRRSGRPLLPAGGLPRLMKTHSGFVRGFASYPAILLTRRPEAVMVSYHRHLTEAAGKRLPDMDRFLRHWRYGIRAWIAFTESWRTRSAGVLRYEDLCSNAPAVLGSLCEILGVEASPAELGSAVEASSRRRMGELLAARGDPNARRPGFEFARPTGGGLTRAQQDYVRHRAQSVLECLGYE